ncbi:latrophilin-like protein LAT-2 [Montipora capricornis]|uniref:latrophilin-like protein LAT-2 n=1 Tax=Montipora capricornis TaxID=246305 RepID=UPI0035F15613
MTEGNKSQSPHCVKHCNISVLCMGRARAPRWLKPIARRCKKGKTQGNGTRRSPKGTVSKICVTPQGKTSAREVLVSKFCNMLEGNTITRKKWVSFMRNMMDTLIRSSDKDEPDIERQENAMMTSDLCENFVAAAYLNESMPFDNQTSEFDLNVTRIFREEMFGFEFNGGDWITISVDDTNETNGSVVMGVRYKKLHRLFTTANNTNKNRTINTNIMSASLFPPSKAGLLKNVTLVFKNLKPAGNDRECVSWDLSECKWSGDGCYRVNFTPFSSETACVCNHSTHFAVLMDLTNVDPNLSQTDRNLLEILTYVGLALSILGSVITIISHLVLTERSLPLFQIRVSLMSSLLTGQITFLVGINATANKGACVAAAALMQYFFMAALCWMLVDGIHLYLFTVKVYNVSHKMLVYHLLSWGIPAVFVSISLGIATGINGIDSFVSDKHCWLSSGSGALWIFATFVALVELANTVIVVRVIKEMVSMQHTSHRQMEQARLGIRACLVLMPLLGITCLLTPVHTAFLYVNVILNSTQGFFIFALHCWPKLKRSRISTSTEVRKPQNSDTCDQHTHDT